MIANERLDGLFTIHIMYLSLNFGRCVHLSCLLSMQSVRRLIVFWHTVWAIVTLQSPACAWTFLPGARFVISMENSVSLLQRALILFIYPEAASSHWHEGSLVAAGVTNANAVADVNDANIQRRACKYPTIVHVVRAAVVLSSVQLPSSWLCRRAVVLSSLYFRSWQDARRSESSCPS